MVEKARELLERTRVEAVRGLARAQVDVEAAQATLATAEAGHRAEWRAAVRAGWSVPDLRSLGLVEPGAVPVKKKKPAPVVPTPARVEEGLVAAPRVDHLEGGFQPAG